MKVLYSLENLPKFRNGVITIGSFDGMHLGHHKLLAQLRKKAGEINGESIVITFYPHPRLVVGTPPEDFAILNTLEEKIEQFRKASIDYLVIVPFTESFSRISAEAYLLEFLLSNFKPAAIIIGYDHKYGANRIGDLKLMQDTFMHENIEIIEVDPLLIESIAVSSSSIRRALQSGEIFLANEKLGYPYFIHAKVVKGDQIGRTIGFPTANLEVPEPYKQIPGNGIYAATLRTSSGVFEGMAYIGTRPVVEKGLDSVIEIHLFNFNKDLYDQEVTISFFEKIRDDLQLGTLGELKQQMSEDEQKTKAFFNRLRSQKPPDKEVSVVVLNYNTVHFLKQYLPDLIRYSPDCEIIVADNGSTDSSVEYVRNNFPEITLITFDKNYGFTGGYNRAIKEVRTTYSILLNSDARVTEGWVEPLIQKMKSNPKKIAIVQPKILNDKIQTRFDYAGAAGGFLDKYGYPFCRGRIFDSIEEDKDQYNQSIEIFWASGAAMVIRTELYIGVGGLDETYFAHMEEIDLAWRLKNLGYQVHVEPASKIYHLGGGTLDSLSPFKTELNFRNSLTTLYKNTQGSFKTFRVIFMRLLLDGVAGFRFLLSGKFSMVWAILKAHFSFYGRLSDSRKAKKALQVLSDKWRIDQANNAGLVDFSIVYKHFISGIKTFKQLTEQNQWR